MVFHDRPVYQEEHAAQLIMARREFALHTKAEYICADLSIDPSLFPCSPAADHTFFEHYKSAPPEMNTALCNATVQWSSSDALDYFAPPLSGVAGFIETTS